MFLWVVKLYQMDVAHAILFATKIDISKKGGAADYSSVKSESSVCILYCIFPQAPKKVSFLNLTFLGANQGFIEFLITFNQDSSHALFLYEFSHAESIHPL